jgi:hypothetical protein
VPSLQPQWDPDDRSICKDGALPSTGLQFPANIKGFSIIVKENATIGVTKIGKAVAVGGRLGDTTSDDSAVVAYEPDSDASYINQMSAGIWNFTTTVCDEGGRGLPFDWAQFEKIADEAMPYGKSADGYRIFVVDQGGSFDTSMARKMGTKFSLDDFAIDGKLGKADGAKSMVIFKGRGTVVLVPSKDGFAFGPTVLAPYAKVVLDGNLGFADGLIIAKSLTDYGKNRKFTTLRGNAFAGEIIGRPTPVTYDDPHVQTLSGKSFFMHGVGTYEYASLGGVQSQVYMCPFAPCTKEMMRAGECFTYIMGLAVKTNKHKIVLMGSSVTVDGKEMTMGSWEGGMSDIPFAIMPVGMHPPSSITKRTNHEDLRGCLPDSSTDAWLWHNCTKAGWDIVTSELSLNVGVLGPFEKGWLKEEVGSRTFNLGVSQVRESSKVRGLINGDVNGEFRDAGDEYYRRGGEGDAQVTADPLPPGKSIFPPHLKVHMDKRCGAAEPLRLNRARGATRESMKLMRSRVHDD